MKNNKNHNSIIDSSQTITSNGQYEADASERHIDVVTDDCEVEDEIIIEFENSEAADGFHGLILCW